MSFFAFLLFFALSFSFPSSVEAYSGSHYRGKTTAESKAQAQRRQINQQLATQTIYWTQPDDVTFKGDLERVAKILRAFAGGQLTLRVQGPDGALNESRAASLATALKVHLPGRSIKIDTVQGPRAWGRFSLSAD